MNGQNPRRRQGGENWFARQWKMRPKPAWMVITAHVLVLTAALLLYAVPHHVRPRQEAAIGLTSSRSVAQPTATPEPAQPAATPEPAATQTLVDGVGEFRVKFADKFTTGAVEQTENSYRSANVNVTFSTLRHKDANVNIADIYVADISCLTNAFGKDTFGRGSRYAEHPTTIAARYNAVATLSGDYYGGRSDGVVIRNGTLYRDENVTRDVCVLYWDGTMKCFSPSEFNAEREMANGAYQAWNFGPMLLTADGLNMETFNSDVTSKHPRSIIGYYEPGHYCLIMVDGRSDESEGLNMEYCSILAYTLGLKQAYNLDGGESATLVKGNTVFGVPYKGGRNISDVIMIVDGNQ